jgi:hypothetical protein
MTIREAPVRLRPIHFLELVVALALICGGLGLCPARTGAEVEASSATQSPKQTGSSEAGVGLESAASRAGSTGRRVAMSLIGLAFAVAATVLAFRRDFKEAAGVFAVGMVSVLLASPAGLNLLQDTVTSLFGSQ